jgi:methyl-accepting chemotaxis protein
MNIASNPSETSAPLNSVDTLFNFLRPDGSSSDNAVELWKILEPVLADILDDFYADIRKQPELSEIFGPFGDMEASIRNRQLAHWKGLLTDEPNLDFESRAIRIAEAHTRIGLPSHWYLAAYGRVIVQALPALMAKHRHAPRKAEAALQAFISRAFLDICLAQEGYENGIRRRVEDRLQRDSRLGTLRGMASTIASVNEMMLNMAVLQSSTQESTANSESISAAAEELVASAEQIAQNSDGAADQAEETNHSLTQSIEAMGSVAASIGEIDRTSQESADSLVELNEAAEQISGFLGVIQTISDQTNLLALNATIEAARAGDAGKGFAVVASEVKSLATQAAKATEDIAERITALKHGMSVIENAITSSRSAVEQGRETIDGANGRIRAVGDQVSSVSHRMQEISSILQQQKSTSEEISSNIAGVADRARADNSRLVDMNAALQTSNDAFMANAQESFRADCNRSLVQMAKIDHVFFKKRVVDIVVGRAEGCADDLPDHHNCRLGKWYDRLDIGDIKTHPAYTGLAAPHARVHDIARQVLEAHDAGNKREAFARLSELEEVSQTVLNRLDALGEALETDLADVDHRGYARRPVEGVVGRYTSSSHAGEIVIRDVSEGGVGVSGPNLGETGRALQLEVGGQVVLGEIAWSDGQEAGIRVLKGHIAV